MAEVKKTSAYTQTMVIPFPRHPPGKDGIECVQAQAGLRAVN